MKRLLIVFTSILIGCNIANCQDSNIVSLMVEDSCIIIKKPKFGKFAYFCASLRLTNKQADSLVLYNFDDFIGTMSIPESMICKTKKSTFLYYEFDQNGKRKVVAPDENTRFETYNYGNKLFSFNRKKGRFQRIKGDQKTQCVLNRWFSNRITLTREDSVLEKKIFFDTYPFKSGDTCYIYLFYSFYKTKDLIQELKDNNQSFDKNTYEGCIRSNRIKIIVE